jgi:ABC-2 type transport system ATP-binding protein
VIDTENLTRKFGGVTAVDRLSFHVNEGEIFGFLGPNGAGKTTTVRMLCCLISKTSGEARIAGYDVGNNADSLKIRKLIGLVPDNVGLYEDLTAYENPDHYEKLYKCRVPKNGKHRALSQDAGIMGEEGHSSRIIFQRNEAKACGGSCSYT